MCLGLEGSWCHLEVATEAETWVRGPLLGADFDVFRLDVALDDEPARLDVRFFFCQRG